MKRILILLCLPMIGFGQYEEMIDMRAELDGRLKTLEEILNTTTLNK